ncbi:hypothetical protein E4K63_04540 [Allofrancisella inopinata]|uniref:Uncharacterized protein n=1 Tax=Allofrancisella inopinata TaxID=1085647 RepID=A0AAE7CRC1_9GAMM|nr:hypothetical protein [Allofrancisella inopinata]QIV96134.1 hypothetical protein E4K63_04540 [Allofrancisella inopinata]
MTQHYVSTAETYYNTKNANIKQPQSSHINYYQALETIDRSFVFLLDALLENKEKYLDVYQNLELFKILSFYTTLVLHNDIEVLKTISQDSSNLLLNPMTTTEYIRTRLPELKEEIGELVNHYAETKKKYEYNNIFGIGYSQQEKFSALNKLYTLIGKKQTNYNYDTSSSIFKLDEKDKCILKNGKTGQKLESLAARYGLLSLDNLLALL